jgi:dolichol kinase
MRTQIAYTILIIGAVLIGLWVSNILFDLKVPQYISRKIGHGMGGMGFLLCGFIYPSGWIPLFISAGFVMLLAGARLVKPSAFRGVGGTGRSDNVLAEVYFPLSALPVIYVGWVWLNHPWETIACLLFMAWGDCVTGIVRSQVYGHAVKGIWGSVAMLIVCLVISLALVPTFWVGAVASVVATIAEYVSGDVGLLTWADDNWTIPIVSGLTMLGLMVIF